MEGAKKREAKKKYHHPCKRCGYESISSLEHPKRCTACKSPYWDKKKTRGIVEAISEQPGRIVPIDSIVTDNVISKQRKGFERKAKQKAIA